METNKNFVPYTLAIKLKELGFDEPCFGYWYTEQESYKKVDIQISTIDFLSDEQDYILAPLWQQAFDWMREKHDLQYWLHDGGMLGKTFIKITGYKHDKFYMSSSEPMEYEEAQEQCLIKLIEIVQDGTQTN